MLWCDGLDCQPACKAIFSPSLFRLSSNLRFSVRLGRSFKITCAVSGILEKPLKRDELLNSPSSSMMQCKEPCARNTTGPGEMAIGPVATSHEVPTQPSLGASGKDGKDIEETALNPSTPATSSAIPAKTGHDLARSEDPLPQQCPGSSCEAVMPHRWVPDLCVGGVEIVARKPSLHGSVT
eukprot:6470135-Amphidinium_carterae.1